MQKSISLELTRELIASKHNVTSSDLGSMSKLYREVF